MWLLVPASAIANLCVTIIDLYIRISVLWSLKERCTTANKRVLALETAL